MKMTGSVEAVRDVAIVQAHVDYTQSKLRSVEVDSQIEKFNLMLWRELSMLEEHRVPDGMSNAIATGGK